MFIIKCRVVINIWSHSSISFKHVSLWCLLFDPHRTTYQSNVGVRFRKVTALTPTYYNVYVPHVITFLSLMCLHPFLIEILKNRKMSCSMGTLPQNYKLGPLFFENHNMLIVGPWPYYLLPMMIIWGLAMFWLMCSCVPIIFNFVIKLLLYICWNPKKVH